MKTPKRIKVFRDIEMHGNFFVEGAKNNEEAMKYLEFEYPETKGQFLLKDVQEVTMHKCLDCESYWVSDDVCGECGEMRLSNRCKYAYSFEIK